MDWARWREVASFDRVDRIPEFQDRAEDVEFLQDFNSALLQFEEKLVQFTGRSNMAPILIVSPPRSGSTLLYQRIAKKFDVGYVSNIMARFYGAPLVGAHFQEILFRGFKEREISFQSRHGNTSHFEDVHEFGLFFSQYFPFIGNNHEELDMPRAVEDFETLQTRLEQISSILRKPIVVKCPLALLVLPEIVASTNFSIVTISRNRDELVESILRVREERLGSREKWWSIRPLGWEELSNRDPREQVHRQIDRIQISIEKAKKKFPTRILELSFYDVTSDTPRLEQALAPLLSDEHRNNR